MQDMSSDCGVAVLKSLLQHYKRYSEQDLMERLAARELSQGLSLADLADVLAGNNIHGSWYEVEDTTEIPFDSPLIIVTEEDAGNHYSIVYEEKNGSLCVSNPAEGALAYVEKEMILKKFAGYVYVIERVDKRKRIKQRRQEVSSISRQERRDITLFTTLKFILPLFITFALQYLMLFRGLYADYAELMLVVSFFIILVSIEIINKHLSKRQALVLDYRGKQAEVNAFMQKVDTVQNRREHNMYNDIITFWTNFNASNKAVVLYGIKLELTYVLLFLLLLAYFSLTMFVFTLGATILLLVLIFPQLQRLKNYHKAFMNKMGALSTFVEEYTKNKVDRYVFTDEVTVARHVERLLSDLRAERRKVERIEQHITYYYDVTMYVLLLSTFCFKVVGTIHELPFHADNFFFCFFIIYILFNSLKATINKTTELTKYNTVQHERNEQETKDLRTAGHIVPLDDEQDITTITLRDVSFSYDAASAILQHVQAEMRSGSLFLIDGDNGAGKTTLLHCILGLEQEYTGEIVFSNNNATNIRPDQHMIRENFSYYAAHQYLNYGTIKKNIGYDIYNDEVKHEVINYFGLDLHKVIFYNGENLSLGEKQKVLLSRCLNKAANVYIFDEPTTNLDQESKQQLIELLLALKQQHKLVVVVTHDDDLKKVADDTLYLHKVVA
jgi:ABC-type bacteriocin/lantibiotic exporter with double-glycine peptidase domain